MIERKTDCCQQISGNDESGRPVLSVLAKRTYLFDAGQWCVADEQTPIVADPIEDDKTGGLIDDTDLFPIKPATDVVIKGHIYVDGRPQVRATIRIANHEKQLLAIGDRTCHQHQDGRLVFANPQTVEKISLSYEFAYGGRDEFAQAKYPDPFLKAMGPSVSEDDIQGASLFQYPRNPIGRGYLVEANSDSIEQLWLPNLEDPVDLLTPERIVMGNPLRWPLMPLPACTGWVHYGWFPRFAYLGFPPATVQLNEPLPEVARGYAPGNILTQRHRSTDDVFRFTNGASLGLQLPTLAGGEHVALGNFHPTLRSFSFDLPSMPPRIWTDGRQGKLNQTQPVIHTIVIEPDVLRLSVLWRGSAVALRPYLPHELERMPFRVQW